MDCLAIERVCLSVSVWRALFGLLISDLIVSTGTASCNLLGAVGQRRRQSASHLQGGRSSQRHISQRQQQQASSHALALSTPQHSATPFSSSFHKSQQQQHQQGQARSQASPSTQPDVGDDGGSPSLSPEPVKLSEDTTAAILTADAGARDRGGEGRRQLNSGKLSKNSGSGSGLQRGCARIANIKGSSRNDYGKSPNDVHLAASSDSDDEADSSSQEVFRRRRKDKKPRRQSVPGSGYYRPEITGALIHARGAVWLCETERHWLHCRSTTAQ